MNFGALLSSTFLTKLKAVFGKTYFQKKALSGNVSINGIVSDLTFNNLIIGNSYKFSCIFKIRTQADSSLLINPSNGLPSMGTQDSGSSSTAVPIYGYSLPFTATETSLTFTLANMAGNDVLFAGSEVRLEELPNHETTTKFN